MSLQPPKYFKVLDYRGIAFRTDKYENGVISGHMVGDDTIHHFSLEEVIEIEDDEFCAECGQIGCMHDGRERSN